MPTPFAPTFASAAASTNGDNTGTKRESAATNEWSRRANGATQTFRKSSSATNPSQSHPQTRENASSSSANHSGAYIPPHLNTNLPSSASRTAASHETRYSKDQLLNVYQNLKDDDALDRSLGSIFLGSWDPLQRKEETLDQAGRGSGKDQTVGPEICWNYNVSLQPFGVTSMTEEEKQLFSTSVNSPIKLQQTSTKDAGGVGVIGGRKTSLSGFGSNAGGSRPGTRRREPSDSYTGNGPLSPSENKSFPRGDSSSANLPPALLRRRTDFKDDEPAAESKDEPDMEEDLDAQSFFPGLRRAATGGTAATALNLPSASPWSAGPQSTGFASMGSFGSFAIGSTTAPGDTTDKRPGFGSARGGSRFKDLLTKSSSEDITPGLKDKPSRGALGKLPEEEVDAAEAQFRGEIKGRPGRSETNPYDEVLAQTGSTALGGTQEPTREQTGMSPFGPPSTMGVRGFGQEGPYHQIPQGRFTSNDPMSPTSTNPYQSPHGRMDDDDHDIHDPASGLPSFATGRRNVFPSSDEIAPPGAAARGTAGFGGMPGFGVMGGSDAWTSAGLGSAKPGMDRAMGAAFGDPIFSGLTDLQSPGSSGLGGGLFGPAGFGSAGRTSRLGAMFPPAMQEQMRGDSRNESQPLPLESRPDSAQQKAIRDAFDNTGRRQDAFGRGTSIFEESSSISADDANSQNLSGQYATAHSGPPSSSLAPAQTAGARAAGGEAHGLSQSGGSSASQVPPAQQRQMVMPDRMRWIYRDPQGNTQGPFSGLEMHDWFKAGFFTAELQVKKVEDSEYEPLAQLVRRIGNSREPFLVPQIGIPHGPATASQGNNWANSIGSGAPQGAPQPPFASSFPSFGTTLTAEQQNALERRKQEEQFLMARQKEHLAQQQMAMKHMQIQNGMHSLQHHSSAHSLQSQPSFGSIASPSGYQPSPLQGPIQPPQPGGSFNPPGAAAPGPNFAADARAGREEDVHAMMDRMSFNQRGPRPFSGSAAAVPPASSGAANAALQDRARLQQQQQQSDMRAHQEAFLGQPGRNDRLEEFHQLRGQEEMQPGRLGAEDSQPLPIGAQRFVDEQTIAPETSSGSIGHPVAVAKPEPESLSLAQQVQRAAATQQAIADEHVWGRKDGSIDAPPVSISPLPAPAAQRNRQHVADALAAESRSASQTPVELSGPSVAPWAERTVEHPRGPSLKEIQAAEAKRAAEQEEIAAAARRAQLEHERLTQAQAPPPAPGLPSTSTWGSSGSPVASGLQGASAWAKQNPVKPSAGPTGPTKKTLTQIQKEEETRKQRAAAVSASAAAGVGAHNTGSPTTGPAGKRYAELASKAASATSASGAGAWTTVGTGGGKAKTPAAVIATPQPTGRSTSASATGAGKARAGLTTSRTSAQTNQSKATEEFTKWIKGSLGKGLNSNINVDSFVQDLLQLPPEIEIISDSVYASSQTLDGRRFAEEFVRRRKLADKGVIEPASNGSQSAGTDGKGPGGWSEVAKKGPATNTKEENSAAFKVVATKKKGKR